MLKLYKFDPANYIKTEEEARCALMAAFEDDPGDGSLICEMLGNIARARGMSKIASDTGLARESLYRSLSPEGNPEFKTILKICKSLGFSLKPDFSVNRPLV